MKLDLAETSSAKSPYYPSWVTHAHIQLSQDFSDPPQHRSTHDKLGLVHIQPKVQSQSQKHLQSASTVCMTIRCSGLLGRSA